MMKLFRLEFVVALAGLISSCCGIRPSWPLLPIVGFAGALPTDAVVVDVMASGVLVNGIATAEASLEARLRQPERNGGAASVLLRVDRTLCWGAACRIHYTCLRVGFDRVYYAVSLPGDSEQAAIALSKPEISKGAAFVQTKTEFGAAKVLLEALPGPRTTGLSDVYQRISRIRPEPSERVVAVWLDIDYRISVQSALEIIDVAAQAATHVHPVMPDDVSRAASGKSLVLLLGVRAVGGYFLVLDGRTVAEKNASKIPESGRKPHAVVVPAPWYISNVAVRDD